jgi:flagellar basal body-associated protein FliL
MPAEQEDASEGQGGETDVSRPRRGGLLVLIFAIVAAALAGCFWINRKSDLGTAANEDHPVISSLHLETFILNLADADQRSYLRVGIDLGLSREVKKKSGPPVAQVRDAILNVLGESTVDELLTADGKTKLKENLLHTLQERMPELGVEEIYFTEFLIQR